jgi:hypothetical protein
MEYLKTTDKNITLKFDPATKQVEVLDKVELEKQLAFTNEQLASLPKPPTDKELLAWAKENYPQSGVEQSRTLLTTKVSELQAKLEAVK